MRCAELLLAAAAGDVAPPPLQESALESGLRIVVAEAPAGSAAGRVEAVLSLAVGWAEEGRSAGSGLLDLAVDHAVREPEGEAAWHVELLPTRTLLTGTLARESLEAALSKLATRLTAAGVEEERFKKVVEARAAAPIRALDRMREAAWPTSPLGGRPLGEPRAAAPTKEALQQFLAQRVGSEDALLVLVGEPPLAPLELLAGRAFAAFPRARGVAPAQPLEPFPSRARRVQAPAGREERLLGFRLAWREDHHGDEVAFARAFLEAVAQRPAAAFEACGQGALVAFSAQDEADAARLRVELLAAAEELARGRSISQERRAAALDRLEAETRELAAAPAGLARLLADGAEAGDPLAAFGRRCRIESAGLESLSAGLRGRIRPSGFLEVCPTPEGT